MSALADAGMGSQPGLVRLTVMAALFSALTALFVWGPSWMPGLPLRDSPSTAIHLGGAVVGDHSECYAVRWSVDGATRPPGQGRNIPSCEVELGHKKPLWVTINIYPGVFTAPSRPTIHELAGWDNSKKSTVLEGCLPGVTVRTLTTRNVSTGQKTVQHVAIGRLHGYAVTCGEVRRRAPGGEAEVEATLRVHDTKTASLIDVSFGRHLWDNPQQALTIDGEPSHRVERHGKVLTASEWQRMWVLVEGAIEKLAQQDDRSLMHYL